MEPRHDGSSSGWMSRPITRLTHLGALLACAPICGPGMLCSDFRIVAGLFGYQLFHHTLVFFAVIPSLFLLPLLAVSLQCLRTGCDRALGGAMPRACGHQQPNKQQTPPVGRLRALSAVMQPKDWPVAR